MDTIFITWGNSKVSDPHSFVLNLAGKIDLKRNDKYVASSNIITYCRWKNVKKLYKNNKSKIWAPTWNYKFELPAGYWVYHQKLWSTDWESSITFKNKTGYYLNF